MSFQFGNKIFVVETNNSSEEFMFLESEGFGSQVPNTPSVADGFRAQSGYFLDYLNNDFFVYRQFKNDYIFDANFSAQDKLFLYARTDVPIDEDLIQNKIQGIKVSTTPGTRVRKFDNKIVEVPRVFTDHYMEFNAPVNEKEIEGKNLPTKPSIYSSRSEYNYFLKDYEQSITSLSVSENILPNLYCLEFYSLQDDLTKETDSQLNISINNSVPKKYYEVTAISPTVSGDYFAYIPKVYRDVKIVRSDTERSLSSAEDRVPAGRGALGAITGGQRRQFGNFGFSSASAFELEQKFKNLIFAHKDVELINQVQEKKELFPMFNEVKFTTEPIGEVLGILEQSDTLDTLIYSYVASQEGSDVLSSQPLGFSIFNKPVEGQGSYTDESTINVYDAFVNVDRQSFLFTKGNQITGPSSAKIAYISTDGSTLGDKFDFGNFGPTKKFKLNILNAVAKAKLKTIFEREQRTMEEIFSGKQCYNETLFYKIGKFNNGQLIQNIYIPNSSKIDILNYVDTQVKYDKNYTYNISAIKIVIGNQYRYKQPPVAEQRDAVETASEGLQEDLESAQSETSDAERSSQQAPISDLASIPLPEVETISGTPLLSYEYVLEQSVKMFEVPITPNIETRVVDSPPVFPNVDIVPFVGGSNKIRINLSSNTGEYYLQPVIIDEIDETEFNKVREAQKIPSPEPVLFKSDDFPQSYEIRRLRAAPKSYADFKNAIVSSLSTTFENAADPQNSLVADAVSFIDVLQVNTNYYYTFRMRDVHGQLSNPTSVFRVKLIEDSPGFIYPEIAVYDFDEDNMINTTLPFRKYICIKPALAQVLLNNQDSIPTEVDKFSLSQINIGTRDESLIGKKFKIRLISKSSQKKVDLNFQYGIGNTDNSK